MKLTNRGKQRLLDRQGESITEVLIALLISALGLTILASMITASAKMISNSQNTVTAYFNAESSLEAAAGPKNGTVTLKYNNNKIKAHDQEEEDIGVYLQTETINGKKVVSYSKAQE